MIIALTGIGSHFMLSQPIGNEGDLTGSVNEKIKLPEPEYESTTSVEKALKQRRSVREYKNDPLLLSEISQLLWAAQGISDPAKNYRTAPSAGALYPLELYLHIENARGISKGIYKYNPNDHELTKVRDGSFLTELYRAALSQSPVKESAITIVFAAVYERTTTKYNDRGIRYVHMEAGHAAQNVYLQAVSLNLGTVVIGAFDDKNVQEILNMKKDENPLYIMPVGKL